MLVVGKRIQIGSNCMIAGDVTVFGSSGHPTDLAARQAGLPPPEAEVRDVVIGDWVWIGRHSIIFPGVRIGREASSPPGPWCGPCPSLRRSRRQPARIMFRLKPPSNGPLP